MSHNSQLTVPEITHTQALILWKLANLDKIAAVELSQDMSRSSPAFYQLMTRMESAGLIERHTEDYLGRKFTFYSVTNDGTAALKGAIRFYEQLAS